MSITLDLVGWSALAVLPLAAAVAWLMARIGRAERQTVPTRSARHLAWLRGGAAALLVLLLIEPVLTIVRERRVLPVVAVLVDGSGSMGVRDVQAAPGDRLDEAVALGLLAAGDRPDAPRRADALLAGLATGAGQHADNARALARLAEELAGQPRAAEALAAVGAAQADGDPARLSAAVAAARPAMTAAQAELDSAQAAGAASGSPVARALTELGDLDRRQRALRWASRQLAPALAGRAELRMVAMDAALSAADPALPPAGASDPQTALAALARTWSGVPLGGVLVLGDGRQTAGADPTPAARALLARGAAVHAVAVGDPQPPRDLAVAEIVAPAEVMLGERIPLEVRWRAIGHADVPLELVLLSDGVERERRPVAAPDGNWRSERFEPPATVAGLAGFQVRLQRSEPTPASAGSWERTWWTGSSGTLAADRRAGLPERAPAGRSSGRSAAAFDAEGEMRLMRVAGAVVAPIDGEYVFHLAADDQAELRVTVGGRSAVVASVPSHVERGQWDQHPGQRSTRLALAAGQPVAVELWLAQGSGAGFVDLGWTRPDGVVERPLPPERCGALAAPTPAAAALPEASTTNNQADAVVQVHADPLRVLLVDRTPRWETRYLASLLMRDRRVQVERRWLLAESAAAERGEARPLLPAEPGALDRYDAVVLGDLGPADLAVGDEALLDAYVQRRGGFLVLIAGPQAMPGGLGLGALARLVPVHPAPGGAPPPAARLALTAGGRRHPVTKLLADAANDPEIWPLLTVPGWLAGGTVRIGAQALVEAGDARTPVVVAGRAGAGRVLYFGTHEAWRWRDGIGERLHQTLWLQAFRWGLGGRLRGGDPRLQAALDTPVAAPGEAVELRLRSVGADGAAAPVPEVVVEALDEQGESVPGSVRSLTPAALGDDTTELPGQWRAALEGLAPGRWRIRITGRGAAADLTEVRELAVRERAGAELADLGTDLPALGRLTAAGGGRSAHLSSTAAVIEALKAGLTPRDERRSRVHPLWDGWLPLLLVTGLLLAEWLLRRRQGLP